MIINIFQMKDLFTEFRKQNTKKHIAIAVCAFAFAIGVNAFLMGTDTGVKLQASAIEYAGGKKIATADLMLASAGTGTDIVKLRLTHEAVNVREVQATVLFDPTSLKLLSLENDTDKNLEISNVSNVPGVSLVIIRLKQPATIPANTDLFSLTFSRGKTTGKTPVNLASTSFVSNDGTAFELTSEGLEF